MDSPQKATFKKIDKYCYNVDSILGRGSFGIVYLGQDYCSNNKYAVKQIPISIIKSAPELTEAIKNEMEVMKLMHHENLIACHDILTTQNNYYFIMEYCNNGNLTDYLKKRGGKLPEKDALIILKQILRGYYEMLKLGIVHRDLKPDNIFLNNQTFKIGDFGFAKTVNNFSKELMTSAVGTPLYMAPQILTQKEYSTKADLWSIALIYYEMLIGQLPWNPKTQYELVNRIMNDQIYYPTYISDASKDFLQRALQVEERDRASWEDVFSHVIFKDCFRYTAHKNDLKKGADQLQNKLIIKIMEMNIDLTRLFLMIDRDGNGALDFKEFGDLLEKLDKSINREQIEYIFNSIDEDGNGMLSLLEFRKWLGGVRSSSVDPQKIFSKLLEYIKTSNYQLSDVFMLYDQNQSNSLDKFEFCKLVKSIKKDISSQELDSLFFKFDIDGNGVISIEEFLEILGAGKKERTSRSNSMQYLSSPSSFRNYSNDPNFNPPHQNQNQSIYPPPSAYQGEWNNYPSPSPPKNIYGAVSTNGFGVNSSMYNQNYNTSMSGMMVYSAGGSPGGREGTIIVALRGIMYQNGINAEGLFGMVDKSSPFYITFEEFYTFILKLNMQVSEADLNNAFISFDINRDGKISFDEFRRKILNI